MIDADGVETSYDYDAQDRLITATTPAGAASYRYWADGLLQGASLPSGLEEARCYDPAGRVRAIVTARGAIPDDCANAAGMASRFDYAYDANGNRVRQLERRTEPGATVLGDAEETRYGYDEMDRLVGVGYPDRTVLYRLDAVGNRTGERVMPAAEALALTVASYSGATTGLTSDLTATFNRVDWLVAQTDAVDGTRSATYGYDSAGNLTDKVKSGTVRRLRWSARNTLTAVQQGPSATQLVEVGRYDYDANLQRLSRTTATESVEYVLDDRHVLQEASGTAGHPSYRRYHYGTGPLLVEDGGTRRFISSDALGSTTDLTTTGGSVSSMRKYDAWGQYRNDTAPAANEPKLGFTGHQYDPETGLVYARARYYDPDLGRFLSRDSYEGSLTDAPSLHRYAYGQNNPLTYVDEDGHAVNLAAAGVGALIGGVGGCLVGAWSGGWEGCGKGALVGAGTGALAGLTFGASLAATGALGVGGTAVASGGTTGSVLVAGTMAGAVGGAASGAGNVLVNGGSGTDALEAAENNAFLGAVGGAAGSAVAPWLGGAVVQSTGSQTLGKVGAGIAGAVVGDTAAQVTAVAGGIQQDFSGKQVAVAAAFGVGGALLPEGILTPRTRTAAAAKVVVEAVDAPTTVSLPARAVAEPKLLPARTATALARDAAGTMPAAVPAAAGAAGTQRVFSVTPKGVAVSSETLLGQGSSPRSGDFTGLAGASVEEIVSRIPSGWRMVPQDKGRGIKFLDQAGVERVRLHAASPKAPPGSNSASGWTLRVQDAAGNYYDEAGNVVPYKANEGHIPIWGNPKAP